ncbi:hypothetical protein QLL95_gp0647 [Cotonvirus japonicus]|uniref:AAA+ ATPase domain-containing protein n=1 Tax=Cotonvirus japonicus TaxID=2811091 RepID=A0ABM7NTN8_9VIRU|nr:hypothetical protein QLL95_gp0647 [Cotonvirus japonicus]BCS83476.1 hypothetical protein [Cotonvirus japonicus]
MQGNNEVFLSSGEGRINLTAKNTVSLTEFNDIILNKLLIIVGRRGSGKTEIIYKFINDIVSNNSNTELFIINQSQVNIHHNIKKIYSTNRLKDIYNYITNNKSIPKLLIIDECDSLLNTKELMDLTLNGKYMNLTVIIVTQTTYELKPFITLNMNYMFIMTKVNTPCHKRIYDRIMSNAYDYSSYTSIVEKVLEQDKRSLVIMNNIKPELSWLKLGNPIELSDNLIFPIIPEIDIISKKKEIMRKIVKIQHDIQDIIADIDDIFQN